MTDRTGTIESGWTVDRLPDLTGRTYLITGANSGIGFEACRHLRRRNADVLVAARSSERGRVAAARIAEVPSTGSVQVIQLDLASTDSIRAANALVRERTEGLDAIVNNAGVMQTPQQKTADGFELQFGTNHLGHFLLNHLLFDLVAARRGRIVPVASIVHLRAKGIDFEDPMLEGRYTPTGAYYQSKLANLTYGLELARRLEALDHAVTSVSCHPGYSATNLQSSGPTGLMKLTYRFTNLFAQRASDGAAPEALAAAAPEARNGAYYGPTGIGDARGPVGESRINPVATDLEAGRRLWDLSEELLDVRWDLG